MRSVEEGTEARRGLCWGGREDVPDGDLHARFLHGAGNQAEMLTKAHQLFLT